MATDKKVKRLSKVAKEFNVGIHTLVDYLNKKGYNVDTNPNAKVSPEQYELLLKEYSSEIDVKRQSEKIGKSYSETKSSISVGDMDKKEEEAETETEDKNKEEKEDELFIKDVSGKKAEAQDTEEKEEEATTEKEEKSEEDQQETTEPKVIGKIDLDSFGKSKKKKKEEPPKEESKKEEQVPKEEAEKEEEQVEGKEEPVDTEKETKEEAEEKSEEPAEETAGETDSGVDEQEEEHKEEEISEEEISEEEISEEEISEEEKEKIKVVGKIDLDSLNQKTRPDKKTRKEREAERQAKEKVQREKRARKKETEEGSKTSAGESTGKEKEKEREKAGSKEDFRPKRKRRKRIHKDKERVQIDEKKSAPDEKKYTRKKKKKKRPVHKDIKEEDVQKQIKETLSRLESKGKSKAAKYRREKRNVINQRQKDEEEKQEQEKNVLKVTEFVSVNELATMMSVPVNDVIQTCMNLGLLVSINQRLDAETMALVADEYNYKVEFVSAEVHEAIQEDEDNEEDLQPRDPIITVMGHVDHGKTSLLDFIREENVIAGEAGGITQHIGAYRVEVEEGRSITFLDTPGHEAFTAMRARGAQITDIAIIVVAADDNIMPQTIEAINHASAAGVPIIFAINKIDKPGASPERIKEELANMNYLVEDWGGKYQSQDISAKNGVNIEELLEKVLLESDIQDLKANPNKQAKGTVIESWLDRGRGYIANLLVQGGTMRVGEVILAGSHMGRVRAMFNERGQRLEAAGPSQPVQLLGLNGAPQAGDKFNVMESEKEAKEIANKRGQLEREQNMRTQKHITLDEIGRRIAIGNFKEVNLVVKGDVDGSIEALSDSFSKLSTEELQVNIIHKGIGQITESDILLAAASNAIIIGFQVRPSSNARKIAEKEQIDIRLYSVIYDAINDMRDALEGMLTPEVKEEITGYAEVKETFKIKKVGTVAGCIVRDGKLERNSRVRVIRDGIVIYTGELESLKRFKDDVKEVRESYECGLNVKNYNDIKVGDYIEGFKQVEVKRTLDTSQQQKA
ncbi:MAG: translation initiation factor IF-2 [Bacteroidales bacterium]|nr:translation initiation factor IF-2 [Bacteroidales bacterium]